MNRPINIVCPMQARVQDFSRGGGNKSVFGRFECKLRENFVAPLRKNLRAKARFLFIKINFDDFYVFQSCFLAIIKPNSGSTHPWPFPQSCRRGAPAPSPPPCICAWCMMLLIQRLYSIIITV